jgi:NAD(P)-dependent dehydrogenase (short-subunit alcohol dehydrogenase family)
MADQKVIWLTGCSRGLGRVMTEGFRRDGWRIAGCARDTSMLENDERSWFADVDVRDANAVRDFCEEARGRFGAPDLLVNNAATINSPGPLWEVTEEDFGNVMDVNLKGVANVIRAAVPMMIARGSGVIVNFSSGWGRSVSPDVAPYCTTKWGIEGMSKALADELPSGLAAVALNPGVIDTEMLRKTWGEGASRFPKAEEWGKRAVPFLQQISIKDNGASLTVG